MNSLKLVFVPQIQRDLDCYIQAWNNHRVRRISENGRSIPGHVPKAAFQMHEHVSNRLGRPTVDAEHNARFLSSTVNLTINEQTMNLRATLPTPSEPVEVVGLQAHEDFTTPQNVLSDSIIALRDRAYTMNSEQFDDVNKYLLHVNLTVECARALASPNLTLLEFFQRRASDPSTGQGRHVVQLLVDAARQ